MYEIGRDKPKRLEIYLLKKVTLWSVDSGRLKASSSRQIPIRSTEVGGCNMAKCNGKMKIKEWYLGMHWSTFFTSTMDKDIWNLVSVNTNSIHWLKTYFCWFVLFIYFLHRYKSTEFQFYFIKYSASHLNPPIAPLSLVKHVKTSQL